MFNWAIIGTGSIANTVAKEIVKSRRHKITAVYSRTLSRAEAFASRFGGKCYDNLNALLSDNSYDGVYIATPHSVHYRNMLDCISHGKPVLSEKSFTVNVTQAKDAIKRAKENKVFVAEGMWTRFNPVTLQVQKWIEEGRIGEVKSFTASFSLPLVVAKPFVSDRVYKPDYAGGALLDLGVYPVSYAQMLFKKPDKISCKQIIKDGVDYDDKITLEYNNGTVCNLFCSFNHFKPFTAVIRGTKGVIKIPMFYRPKKATLIVGGKIEEKAKCKRGYIYQFDAVAEDIINGRMESSFIPHNDTLEVMAIMDECRRLNNFSYPKEIEQL